MMEPPIFENAPSVVPRAFMPQVHKADYPALFEFIRSKGITVDLVTVVPSGLHWRQHVNGERVDSFPAAKLAKPILLSSDNCVLDGNHRAAAAHVLGLELQAYRLGVPFLDAVKLLYAFPATYDVANDNDERD